MKHMHNQIYRQTPSAKLLKKARSPFYDGEVRSSKNMSKPAEPKTKPFRVPAYSRLDDGLRTSQ